MTEQDFIDLYALEQEFWWFKGMKKITETLLHPYLTLQNDNDILDDGCGTGGMLSWLEQFSGKGKITGIDISPVALDFCRKSGNLNVIEASATELPFNDSSFNVVTSFDVLVQLPGEYDDKKAIDEIFRVLKPGGITFIRVAAHKWMRSGHDQALESHKRYTRNSIKNLVAEGGFEIRRSTYANMFLFPLAIFRRLILKPLHLVHAGSDVRPLPNNLKWVNRFFTLLLYLESYLIGKGVNLFTGLSVIVIAYKPKAQ